MALILHYFAEFVYDVVVKQLLGLPWFQNRLLIVYDLINTKVGPEPWSAPSPDWNCQWGPYPRHVRASMLPKKETRPKYSYNAFQVRDRRDKSECDSAVYSSLHAIQSYHLVFFDF